MMNIFYKIQKYKLMSTLLFTIKDCEEKLYDD